MLQRSNMHAYQIRGVEHIIANPFCALFLDMGLGKTVTTLTAISDMLNYLEVSKVLVIAPKRVTEVTWADEIDNWAHLRHLRISIIAGGEKQRLRAMAEPADIYAVSRDNVAWLVAACGGQKLPYDMIVVDELSSFKNSKSVRFKALKKVRKYAHRFVGLTGTPSPNGLMDLFAQMYLVDAGERLGRSIMDYRARYFKAGAHNGDTIFNYIPLEHSQRVIADKIGDICLSMKATDYLDMPAKNVITDYVVLSKKVKQMYDDFEAEQVMRFFSADTDDATVSALSAAALSNKLLQFANGAIYDDAHEVVEVHDEKLEKLEELVESANGSPVLIAYAYKHDLTRIMAKLKKYAPVKLDGADTMRDWNDGKTKVLVTHPASAGHGLNLQRGGNNIIWFGTTWSLELYLQFNARLWRQGQDKPVFIHHIVAKGTMDERVMQSIAGKESGQNALLEAIKDLIHRVKLVNKSQ